MGTGLFQTDRKREWRRETGFPTRDSSSSYLRMDSRRFPQGKAPWPLFFAPFVNTRTLGEYPRRGSLCPTPFANVFTILLVGDFFPRDDFRLLFPCQSILPIFLHYACPILCFVSFARKFMQFHAYATRKHG